MNGYLIFILSPRSSLARTRNRYKVLFSACCRPEDVPRVSYFFVRKKRVTFSSILVPSTIELSRLIAPGEPTNHSTQIFWKSY